LTKFGRAAKVAIPIPVAAVATSVAGVVTVRVSGAVVATEIALVITVKVVSVLECLAKITLIKCAVAET